MSSSTRRHIAAVVAYDGTAFAGFQRQPADRTVQATLEAMLSDVAGEAVCVTGAGRTDAGVHATGQVIGFSTCSAVPPERWWRAVNPKLPGDVCLRRSQEVDASFCPRRSALARQYGYTLVEDEAPDPVRDRYATRVEPGLDWAAIEQAARVLPGEHDFVSLCCNNGQAGSTRRHLRSVELGRGGGCVTVRIVGDSFLYKQVRCMIGALLAIGRGKFAPSLIEELLEGRPRPATVAVAPPTGLVLERVHYAPETGWDDAV